MEIKKGMYVRFRDLTNYIENPSTNIDKIKDTYEIMSRASETLGLVLEKYREPIERKDVIGEPSYDPIDLLEEGDIIVVDGIKYTILRNKEHCNNILHIKTIDNKYSTIKYLFEQNMIESVVTHEQFEQMSYKVGE